MHDHNPLKQYFRRPSIYLKLPSRGVGYDNTVLTIPESGELPVYPMTALDEITAKTPDALYNGMAVCDIIKSCVPSIKDPWKINNLDMDAILVAIRIATNGAEMEIESTCPSCNEESKYGVNLSRILGNFVAGDYDQLLTINDLKIKFKPMNYREVTNSSVKQFEIQKALQNLQLIENEDERTSKSTELLRLITNSTMDVMANTIEYIQTPDTRVTEKEFILEFIVNSEKSVFELIKDTGLKLRETTQMKPLNMKCVNCSHEYEQTFTLNISDFFE